MFLTVVLIFPCTRTMILQHNPHLQAGFWIRSRPVLDPDLGKNTSFFCWTYLNPADNVLLVLGDLEEGDEGGESRQIGRHLRQATQLSQPADNVY